MLELLQPTRKQYTTHMFSFCTVHKQFFKMVEDINGSPVILSTVSPFKGKFVCVNKQAYLGR